MPAFLQINSSKLTARSSSQNCASKVSELFSSQLMKNFRNYFIKLFYDQKFLLIKEYQGV